MLCSIASVAFGDPSSSPCYVVGTAFYKPEEAEPSKGRIILLQYNNEDRSLSVVTERQVKGAVYSLLPFQTKLINTWGNKVQIHK
jgi:DNA damage-binding protein 1